MGEKKKHYLSRMLFKNNHNYTFVIRSGIELFPIN